MLGYVIIIISLKCEIAEGWGSPITSVHITVGCSQRVGQLHISPSFPLDVPPSIKYTCTVQCTPGSMAAATELPPRWKISSVDSKRHGTRVQNRIPA